MCSGAQGLFQLVYAYIHTYVHTHTHTQVVSSHVHVGELDGIELHVVDYGGIRDDPNFGAYLEALKSADISWFGRNDTYAFFMNAYNALAIKMIIDHPCKKSTFLRWAE